MIKIDKFLEEHKALMEEQEALMLSYRLALNNANKSSQEVTEKLSELLDNMKQDGEQDRL